MTLTITSAHLGAIRAHAERTYPEECCGLVLGVSGSHPHPDSRTAVELWPVDNNWTASLDGAIAPALAEGSLATKTRRYWIDPKDVLAAQRHARDQKLNVIGVYHSHPDHPAVPSECDRTLAWPGYSYLIVSVPQGHAQDLLSWSLDDNHQFQPEALLIGVSVDPSLLTMD